MKLSFAILLIVFFQGFLNAQVIIPFSFWAINNTNLITTVNECPISPQGSLSITVNYNAADATSCQFVAANAAFLSGAGVCSCAAGVCKVTGLIFTQAFLSSMAAGANATVANALNYSVTRPSGTFTNSQNLKVTTGTWNANCLGSNLLMWLDATDGTTLFQDTAAMTPATNGTTVARWNDKSGNNANATQATAAYRPTYTTGSSSLTFVTDWNSNFNFFNSALTMGGTTGFNGAVGSMFAVAKQTNTGGNSYISLMGFRNGGGNLTGFSNPNSTNWGLDWWTSGVYGWVSGATINTTSFAVAGWNNSASTQTFSLNGTTYTNSTATTTIPSTPAVTLMIGNDNCCGNTRYFNGLVSELLVIKLNLIPSLRYQIEGYLAWKYGLSGLLPAGHMYKSFAP